MLHNWSAAAAVIFCLFTPFQLECHNRHSGSQLKSYCNQKQPKNSRNYNAFHSTWLRCSWFFLCECMCEYSYKRKSFAWMITLIVLGERDKEHCGTQWSLLPHTHFLITIKRAIIELKSKSERKEMFNKLASLEAVLVRKYNRLTDRGKVQSY